MFAGPSRSGRPRCLSGGKRLAAVAQRKLKLRKALERALSAAQHLQRSPGPVLQSVTMANSGTEPGKRGPRWRGPSGRQRRPSRRLTLRRCACALGSAPDFPQGGVADLRACPATDSVSHNVQPFPRRRSYPVDRSIACLLAGPGGRPCTRLGFIWKPRMSQLSRSQLIIVG